MLIFYYVIFIKFFLKTRLICFIGYFKMGNIIRWSGRRDSNSRPSGPKPDALARLRYAPKYRFIKKNLI